MYSLPFPADTHRPKLGESNKTAGLASNKTAGLASNKTAGLASNKTAGLAAKNVC